MRLGLSFRGGRKIMLVALFAVLVMISQNVQAQEENNDQEVNNLEATIVGASEFSTGTTQDMVVSVQNNMIVESIDPGLGELDLVHLYGAAVGLTANLREGDAPLSVETSRLFMGTLSSGEIVSQVPFTLKVQDEVRGGSFVLYLDLTYKILDDVSFGQQISFDWLEITETIELPITIEEKPVRFEVIKVSPALQPGMNGELHLTFKNLGYPTAKDVTSKISVSSPFSLTSPPLPRGAW